MCPVLVTRTHSLRRSPCLSRSRGKLPNLGACYADVSCNNRDVGSTTHEAGSDTIGTSRLQAAFHALELSHTL